MILGKTLKILNLKDLKIKKKIVLRKIFQNFKEIWLIFHRNFENFGQFVA